jgi:cytochrome c6
VYYEGANGVVAGAIATSAAVPAFAADVAAGEQVFNANCAARHAGGQNVIMPEKTLEKEALDNTLLEDDQKDLL